MRKTLRTGSMAMVSADTIFLSDRTGFPIAQGHALHAMALHSRRRKRVVGERFATARRRRARGPVGTLCSGCSFSGPHTHTHTHTPAI